jgi:hypothetical protein
LRARYLQRIVDEVPLDPGAAERVAALLFEHPRGDDTECLCSCHPQLSWLRDDGFDCPCTWDAGRRAVEHEQWLASFDGPDFDAFRDEQAAEDAELAGWLAGQVGVTATRTSSFAPSSGKEPLTGTVSIFESGTTSGVSRSTSSPAASLRTALSRYPMMASL